MTPTAAGICGDGILDAGETCEPPGSLAGPNGNICRADCSVCGDGIVDAGEACDDGNSDDSDACPNRCVPHECGDGIVQAGEACDDGNRNNADACRNDCTLPRCGDGIVDAGEQCDDGNSNDCDGCPNNCTLGSCGDGIISCGGGEQCDDGNTNNNDSCRNNCTLPRCGDGILDAGETCDPPGTPAGSHGDICRDNCTVCGDGIVDAGEQCDDGNSVDTDSCPNCCGFCRECGDGIVEVGEQCDDGNRNNADACRNDCTLPFCGDGIVDAGETCDDGNSVPGDGCETDCTPTQTEAICRTPGFWGTHAGTEKTGSQNITEAVIDCADGNCADHTANDFLLICGEKIDSPDSNPADGTTDWNDASSSTEALCVPVKGEQILQLARQLTAAALNCIMSNGDETCASTPLYATVFAHCNTTCADSTARKEELTACIGELDCLNNGKTFANGLCLDPVPGNCSERQLVNRALGLDFEPPGPAGSPDACQAAHATTCHVVGQAEGPPHDGAHCGTDSLP